MAFYYKFILIHSLSDPDSNFKKTYDKLDLIKLIQFDPNPSCSKIINGLFLYF